MSIKDLGVSAYHSKNSDEGNLGTFIEGVKSGKIPKGIVLCVESLDRLTRDNVVSAVNLISNILMLGIDIGLVNEDKILSYDYISKNPYELFVSVTYLIRGNDESKTKSIRVKDSINRNIEKVKQNIPCGLGGILPEWIRFNKTTSQFVVNNDKVSVVKKIFGLYLQGISSPTIVKRLNQDKTIKRTFRPNGIRSLLRNKQTMGTFTINGQTYKDYLPPIIDKSDFDKVQLLLDKNKSKHGKHDGNINNLFNGLIFCHKCGAPLAVHTSGVKHHYFFCLNSRDYVCKDRTYLQVKKTELWIFGVLLKQLPTVILQEKDSTNEKDIDRLEVELQTLKKQRTKTLELLKDNTVSTNDLKPILTDINSKESHIEKELIQKRVKQSQILTTPQKVGEFMLLLGKDLKDQTIRQQLKNTLPSIVTRIEIDLAKNDIRLQLINGEWIGNSDLTDSEAETL
jgi:DNA invertase Pin-like site-specific DNA recombinase